MEFTTHFELKSQTTRLFGIAPYAARHQGMYGIVTLYDLAFQPNYPRGAAGNAPLDYNSNGEARQNDFQVELLPLHSQLLGESLLVSFPPLINMLKSSGSSYLISGPIVKLGWGVRLTHRQLGTQDFASTRFGLPAVTIGTVLASLTFCYAWGL